jgi:hypothetical protein
VVILARLDRMPSMRRLVFAVPGRMPVAVRHVAVLVRMRVPLFHISFLHFLYT